MAAALRDHHAENVVVDPVMVATSGSSLADSSAVRTMTRELFPLAALITPNIPEAQALTGAEISSAADMERAARALAERFGCATLVKGGHGTQDANDVLALPDGATQWFAGERIGNPNTHGTGCTLSSAIAAHLALGEPLGNAIDRARRRHPVERLVRAEFRKDEQTVVRLDEQHAACHGECGLQTAGVFGAAVGNNDSHEAPP